MKEITIKLTFDGSDEEATYAKRELRKFIKMIERKIGKQKGITFNYRIEDLCNRNFRQAKSRNCDRLRDKESYSESSTASIPS